MADIKQWVNLPKKNRFKNDGITSLNRLGTLRFTCKFKNKKVSTFKFRMVRNEPEPNIYADTEIARNPKFKLRADKGTQTVVDDKVNYKKKIHLPAGGGFEYKLEAKHRGAELSSTKTVETWRRLYYQVMKMNGVTGGDLQQLTDDFTDAANKYNIEFKKKGADATIDLVKVITDDNAGSLFPKAKAAYTLQNLKPYAFVILWANYIAEPGDARIEYEGRVSRSHTAWRFDDATKALKIDIGQDLWYGLDDADDAAKKWFRSFRCTITKSDSTTESFSIGRHRASIRGGARRTYGGHNKVTIDLSGKVPDDMTRIDFTLKVRNIEGWSDGLSYNSVNMILVAMKAAWEDCTPNEIAYLVNHELGHKIGMVPDGAGRLPDAPTTRYVGQGHQGPHCTGGATYAHGRWSGATTCVMFGGDELPQPRTFCAQCEKIVRKLDLGTGMPGFANSVGD